jgi:hypothetical protein
MTLGITIQKLLHCITLISQCVLIFIIGTLCYSCSIKLTVIALNVVLLSDAMSHVAVLSVIIFSVVAPLLLLSEMIF